MHLTEGWRRAGGLQLTEGTISSAAFDGRRVFWREANGVFCRALGRRSGRLAAGLRARAAARAAGLVGKEVAAGRGKGAWRVSEAPLVIRRRGPSSGAWARPASCAATATACWSWRTRATSYV